MDRADFERYGHEVIDWVAEYLNDTGSYPVLSRNAPGDVAAALPETAPEAGDSFDAILDDFRNIIIPGITHWNHPGFFAYFGVTAAAPGILAETLTAALNVNAMLWRTSPAATELEEVSLDWLRRILGLPDAFRGHIQDTASTSTLVAMATAREAAGFGIRDSGMIGRDIPVLRLYCSEEAHSSVEKAAITLGIGRNNTVRIPTDGNFRLRVDALRDAIEADLTAGHHPLCLVATAGTTVTTSVDPLQECADLANRYGLWFHVDAAYGGAAAISPSARPLMKGWDRADSIVVNPHKWLFVPIDCSALFLRNPEKTRQAFSLVPDYLTTPEGQSVTNLMDYGHALGRRFRSLKLWMTLRYFGRDGLCAALEEHMRLASLFKSWVDADPSWAVVAPVPFSTVCFRYTPGGYPSDELDRLNEQILHEVNRSGEVFLSHALVRGKFTLRLAVGNLGTQEHDVARAWELLQDAARSKN